MESLPIVDNTCASSGTRDGLMKTEYRICLNFHSTPTSLLPLTSLAAGNCCYRPHEDEKNTIEQNPVG